METILRDIIDALKTAGTLDEKTIASILQAHNRADAKTSADATACTSHAACDAPDPKAATMGAMGAPHGAPQPRKFAKKHLMPYFLKVKNTDPELWANWNLTPQQEETLVRALRMKPRRTASGVATITVITKPWPCGSNCLYCPNDVRMPKSYLSDEPACQRAERNFFDPYLQVASRLRALEQMGHATDKVELIVLGGTWSDYPQDYQIWFVHELFRALNDAQQPGDWTDPESLPMYTMEERRAQYAQWGILSEREQLQEQAAATQQQVNAGELTYNQAVAQLYATDAWRAASSMQTAAFAQLEEQHRINEDAAHRVVGLVVETRPDAVNPQTLLLLRRLGCTKVQMGIQTLNPSLLAENTRGTSLDSVRKAFALLRLFGFKTHAHFMVNLLGATPEADKADYLEFVTAEAYQPDEVKLYPCVLVGGTSLCDCHDRGTWQPYSEEDLVDVLAQDVLVTPSFTRVSRMIRDISAHDIVAGNKKTNLRQMVEDRLSQGGDGIRVNEIRFREIGTDGAEGELRLDIVRYRTTVSTEFFLQWVTEEYKIAGFLRLSLPDASAMGALRETFPDAPFGLGEAMIREVHVYGNVAQLHKSGVESGGGAQHLGLGKRLVETACDLARSHGYEAVNVISAVGTRGYYRALGFADNGLYQRRAL